VSAVLSLLVLAGAYLLTRRGVPWLLVRAGRLLGFRMKLSPTTAKRVERFKRLRRGWWAFMAISTLLVLSLFLEILVNHKPLAIGYAGKVAFPAVKDWLGKAVFFARISSFYPKEEFGQLGKSEVDYRGFARTVADPSRGRAEAARLRKAHEEAKAEYLRENPRPGPEATDRARQRWERGYARFVKKEEELAQLETGLRPFEEGRAWIVQTLYPYGPEENRLDFEKPPPNAPSLGLGVPLGTDMSGRDVLVQLVYGFRISLFFSLLVAAAGLVIGVAVGGLQGYYGGWVDIASQRIVEIWSAIPFLFVIMMIVAATTPTFALLLVLMIVLRSWMGLTYYVRGEFYREKGKDYVQAAIGTGVPNWKIMLLHILPNSVVPIVTFTPFAIVGYIGSLVALDYLGFGLPPGTPSWGTLLRQGLENVRFYPHLIIVPGTALVLTLYAIVIVGEAVREAFDPKVFARLR
jgi:microcin C transport system permease protein